MEKDPILEEETKDDAIVCGASELSQMTGIRKRGRRAGWLVIALLACAAAHPIYPADTATETRSPVLIELFTSEGCSSCPPVDAWAQKLDASQPLAGVQLIFLSEHVDYWDHDGWKDPYSSAALTERQRAYAQKLGLTDVYTPQLILDGTRVLSPDKPDQITQNIEEAVATPQLLVSLESVRILSGKPDMLEGRVRVDGTPARLSGEIYIAAALNQAESEVLRGENGGHRLGYVAVVENLAKVGKVEKGAEVERDFQMKLTPGMDLSNLRVIAFVQQPGPGKILGATMEKGGR
jgi:hypothetical protein